jgi:acyl carrier protein
LDLQNRLRAILDSTLALDGRARDFTAETPLLGAVPELDSMAVAELILAIEREFDVALNDDELNGSVFATFGTLTELVRQAQPRAG